MQGVTNPTYCTELAKDSLLNPVHLHFFHYGQALAFASRLDL